jgi:hypothetical protein
MIPIGKVAGVGQALAALLAAKGISTAEQLAKTSPEALRSIPRLGAQRAFALLAAAQKIVAGPESEAPASAPATPVTRTEATTSPSHEQAPALPVKSDKKQIKSDKKAAAKTPSVKSAKKTAKLGKDAKKAEKVEKAAAVKTAKKVLAKVDKAASEKKVKVEKAPKKKVAKAAKENAEKGPKAKPDQTVKLKKPKQSKKNQSKKK